MTLLNLWIFIKIAAAMLVPVWAGFFLAGMLLQSTPLKRSFGLTLSLGGALGWGLFALIYFGWRVSGLSAGWLFVLEAGLLAVCGMLFLRSRPFFRFSARPALPRRWRIFLVSALTLALFLAGLPMIVGYAWFPHGTWDAWSIWSLAARYFYLGGADWTHLFHANNFHPDYPPLLGGSLARLWLYIETAHPLAGGLNAAFISLITVLLTGFALAYLRGAWLGILGALLCLGSSSFLAITVAQIADIPLGLFILAVVVCSYLADELPGKQPVLWILAGTFAGLAAWTKNEGLLVVVCFLTVRVGLHLWRRDGSGLVHEQAWTWSGLLPLLAALVLFKAAFAPPNDLVAAQGGETLGRLLDPERIRQVLAYYAYQASTFSPKLSVPVLFLPLFLAVAGVRRDFLRHSSFWAAGVFLALILGGYFIVYLVSPYDAGWHLKTSAHRLFLHIWPSAVFLTLLLARLPEFAAALTPGSEPDSGGTPAASYQGAAVSSTGSASE